MTQYDDKHDDEQEEGDEQDEDIRAQMTCILHRLGHRYVFLLFFSHFLFTCLQFLLYLGLNYLLNGQGGLGWVVRTKMGPNDVWRRLGQTKGTHFFSHFFRIFLCTNNNSYIIQVLSTC